MDAYAGRVLANRYRLPRPPADEYELVETRAFDTYSGQEVLVRQVLLPEIVSAEPYDGDAYGDSEPDDGRDSADRALAAARAAAAIPDHPRLVQVFDIFEDGGSLWVVSELVAARPLAAVLADKRLSSYRAAEVAADVLTALRALHIQGWTHRNVTVRTVLVCDDGRAMLSGLAVAAAQEALCGYDPLPVLALAGGGGGEDEESGAVDHRWGGPDSVRERERARQARITVVGPVTERWAPEQAVPIQDNWQLAPPVGPAADLWALGSLLYRSVQGHPPFPEESAAELVQVVCAEPPAFAEECGPLRPVVESLLRQDPTERPEYEELEGWLRSLIRSAPEPDLGLQTVSVPADDPRKLPIIRRRGELVRRRKRSAEPVVSHRRHARGKGRKGYGPRRLGAVLVGLVLLLLAAVVAYAAAFMPRTDDGTQSGSSGSASTIPAQVPGSGGGSDETSEAADDDKANEEPQTTEAPATTEPAETAEPPLGDLGGDYTLREDAAGFTTAVADGWTRTGKNADGQVRYSGSDCVLTVVPGRDGTAAKGTDPVVYQNQEPELADFRASAWSSISNLRRLEVNGASAAEGEFSWRDANGRNVFGRNLVMIIDGEYHVILVTGPDSKRADVEGYFEKAVENYRAK